MNGTKEVPSTMYDGDGTYYLNPELVTRQKSDLDPAIGPSFLPLEKLHLLAGDWAHEEDWQV